MTLAHFGYSINDFPFTCSQRLWYFLRTKLDIYVLLIINNNLLEVVVVAPYKAKLSERFVVVMIYMCQQANPSAPLFPYMTSCLYACSFVLLIER